MTQRDIAYRKALGLGTADPLPKAMGTRNAPSLKRPRKTAIAR